MDPRLSDECGYIEAGSREPRQSFRFICQAPGLSPAPRFSHICYASNASRLSLLRVLSCTMTQTQTPTLPEEYSTLIKVLLRPTLSIRYPTTAQLYAFHRANGIVRPIPDHTELQLIAARKVMRMQARPQQPISKAPGASPSVLADEARVREMKGSGVVILAERLGLKFERHATNNGLTCMRARNLLYSHIKSGGKLDENV